MIVIDPDLKQEGKRHIRDKWNSAVDWMRWNGVMVYSYALAFSGSFGAFLSPILNMFQGGNKYPFFSEFIREGVVRHLFFVSSLVGFLPMLFFGLNYIKLSIQHSQLIKNSRSKLKYLSWLVIASILIIYTSFDVILVGVFDMDFYGDIHMFVSASWIIFSEIYSLIQYFQATCFLYKKDTRSQGDEEYLKFKGRLLIFSVVGLMSFVFLGLYRDCTSLMMSMEYCLQRYPEDHCFGFAWSNEYTRYRVYHRCPNVNWIRGLGEIYGVCALMFYEMTLRNDLLKMKSLLSSHNDFEITVVEEDGEPSDHLGVPSI